MTTSSDHLTGKILGTCRLEKLIGRGGMSVVYLAHQSRPSRHVAVKILLPNAPVGSSLHNEFLARFQYEADIIAKLEHIHIIPIFECDEQDGLAYLVMPYLNRGERSWNIGAEGLSRLLHCEKRERYLEDNASF